MPAQVGGKVCPAFMSRQFICATLGLFLSLASSQAARPMELEDLFRSKRVGDAQISPDGKWVAYVVTVVDKTENSSNSDLWLISSDGKESRQLTASPRHDRHPRWSPDGKRIAFESNRGGSFQIYIIAMNGGEARAATSLSTEATQPVWSADGRQIAFVSSVFPEFSEKPFRESDGLNRQRQEERDRSKVKGRVFTQLLYRHWDSWVDGKRQHLFVVPADGGEPRDVTPGARDAVPTSSTFSAGDEYDFSPDGNELAFTATPLPVKEEAWKTDHNIVVVNLTSGERREITAPTLVIHNELDFRVPISEGMNLFTALQRKGIPSKFLYFPDEGHWVLKPQNSELWHQTVFAWLAEYLQ